MRILVVEDEFSLADALREILKKKNTPLTLQQTVRTVLTKRLQAFTTL